MNIETLASVVDEDLELQIGCVRVAGNEMVLEVSCDDWEGDSRRRVFDLFCGSVKESHVSIGMVDALELTEEHPVLLEHKGPQGALFFSSAPARPDEVFYKVHETLRTEFAGWREPSQFLNGDPAVFRAFLEGGYGLLASGPVVVLEKLEASLQTLLQVNVVETYRVKQQWKALVLGAHWVICSDVRVEERGS
jgi:hypothetical protein